jgi:hypothetical protein
MRAPKECPACKGRLIEIDYYGQRLLGCAECNRWGLAHGEEPYLMEMPEDDLEALRDRVRAKAHAPTHGEDI